MVATSLEGIPSIVIDVIGTFALVFLLPINWTFGNRASSLISHIKCARSMYVCKLLCYSLLRPVDPLPFDNAPTYEGIKAGAQKEPVLPGVNGLFSALGL